MNFRCIRCNEVYDNIGKWECHGVDMGTPDDPTWDPEDGRCYPCFLGFLMDLYGDIMEPAFVVNGQLWDADGLIPVEEPTEEWLASVPPFGPVDEIDIPF